MRHRIEPRIELDVIIDVDGRARFPKSELIGRGGQRLERPAVELFEQLATGDGLATEWSVVDQRHPFGNCRIELGEREELPLAQWASTRRSVTSTPTSTAALSLGRYGRLGNTAIGYVCANSR